MSVVPGATDTGTPPSAPPATPPAAPPAKTYTQAELEAAIAAAKIPPTPPAPQPKPGDRVNIQELATLRQMQAKIEELAQGKDVGSFLDEIKPLQDSLMTEQQKAQQASEAARKHEDTAKQYKQRFENSLVEHAVIDAAVPKAHSVSAAKLILRELQQYASVDDKGQVSFKMPVTENNQTVIKILTAEQAVAVLESKPVEFGPLFKSFASTGTGAKGNEHQFKDANGRLSPEAIAALTMPDYIKLRKENPAALGLA